MTQSSFNLPLNGKDEHLLIAEGAWLLRGFVSTDVVQIMSAIQDICSISPFRHMVTPGGFRMSVAMTNCGEAGWVSDRKGYRYQKIDPETQQPWPQLPALFLDIAGTAAVTAGYPDFHPDSCLINRYEPGSRLTLHQDRNESDFTAPIVSVSVGLPAIFLFGGNSRKDRPRRLSLESGDVAVWGGSSRLAFHGIAPLKDGIDLVTGGFRFNLTFRKAL